MRLGQHKAHRNLKYLSWLRKQPCIVSNKQAECAHHIRLGTNGGTSLKPSDYFCVPLLNEYHTGGSFAVHRIGEESFAEQFKIEYHQVFIQNLKEFLAQEHEVFYMLEGKSSEEAIADLISLIEVNTLRKEKPSSKSTKEMKKKTSPKVELPRITENEFYQKAKELKKQQDKELRKKLKEENKASPKAPKQSLKGDNFYEMAKELKRNQQKALRDKMKIEKKSIQKKIKTKSESDYYEKAKALKRAQDKEFRKKQKDLQKQRTS